MTTVYINIIKGTIYTDSRCTTTKQGHSIMKLFSKNKVPKILAFSESQKIFALHKSGVVSTGDTLVSDYLKGVFEAGKNPALLKLPKNLHNRSGSIKIVRIGYVISISTNKDGKITVKTVINDNMTSGSGSDSGFLKNAQCYLWRLTKEQIEKVLRLNSLFDVYSDDKIVCMNSEEYRGTK